MKAKATTPTAVKVPATFAVESKKDDFCDDAAAVAVGVGVANCVMYLVDTMAEDDPSTV